MRPRYFAIGLALVATVMAVVVSRVAAQANSPAASSGSHFQLQTLPGTANEWLVLDTRTGDVQHWARMRNAYTVTTLRLNKQSPFGWEREVLKAPSDSGN